MAAEGNSTLAFFLLFCPSAFLAALGLELQLTFTCLMVGKFDPVIGRDDEIRRAIQVRVEPTL